MWRAELRIEKDGDEAEMITELIDDERMEIAAATALSRAREISGQKQMGTFRMDNSWVFMDSGYVIGYMNLFRYPIA